LPPENEMLLGELKQFKEEALRRFDDLDDKLDRQAKQIETLNKFKWKATGVMAFVFALFQAGIGYLQLRGK